MVRFSALLLSLIMSVAPVALAQGMGDAPPAEKAPPAAVSIDNEPNLKVTQGSGGKSTSSLITLAPLKSDHVMGDSSAPIVMVEYASMSCPHCAHFSGAVLPTIKKNYIDTGKLQYVLRQFPLNEPALKAAMLLDCVGEQDSKKYYVFSGVLFDAQNKWAFDGNYMEGLETIAMIGGLSKAQFAGCLQNTDREMRVLKVKQAATDELRLPHTPYIFIAGEVYDGDRTVEAVSRFIDAKLAEFAPKP